MRILLAGIKCGNFARSRLTWSTAVLGFNCRKVKNKFCGFFPAELFYFDAKILTLAVHNSIKNGVNGISTVTYNPLFPDWFR
jgi:hypothetical protein